MDQTAARQLEGRGASILGRARIRPWQLSVVPSLAAAPFIYCALGSRTVTASLAIAIRLVMHIAR
jgi:hypothetical protein